jgi:chemoreceptor zinc-binding protein
MDKRAALDALRAATSAHIKWRAYAQALIAGVEVSEEKIPVSHTDCVFGKWYYGEGQRQLGHLASFQDLEAPHQILHAVYRKIFEVLHGPDHRSFLGRIFGGKAAYQTQQRERASVEVQVLIDTSETLLRAIKLVEDEVRALAD